MKRGRVAYDEGVLILPRARDELTLRDMPRDFPLSDRMVPA
jgi:hypothetical protein